MFKVQVGKYDFQVYSKKGYVMVGEVKTTRQRNFRTIRKFKQEMTGEKENRIDTLLYTFSRTETSLEDEVKEQDEFLESIGVSRVEIIEGYRYAKIEYIKNKEYK